MRIRAKFEICFHANTAPPRDAFFMRPVDAIGAKGYDDVRALARGRYGAVYEARRRACGTLCAVKVSQSMTTTTKTPTRATRRGGVR